MMQLVCASKKKKNAWSAKSLPLLYGRGAKSQISAKKTLPLITSNNNTNYMQKLCVAEDYTQRKLDGKQSVPQIQQKNSL